MPLTQDDQVKYKDLYLQTAKPYIAQLQDAFTQFSQGIFDKEVIDTAYRSAHSLNSQSVMMGYMKVSSLTSLIEKVMKAVIDAQLQLTVEIGNVLKNGSDKLGVCVESIEKNTGEIDLSAEVASLTDITKISI